MGAHPRVVLASPHRAEREMLAEWLASEGLEPVLCSSAPAAIHEIQRRPYDVLVADAGLAFDGGLYAMSHARSAQTPAIVVGESGTGDEVRATRQGAMYVARPVERVTLLCSVSMALIDCRPSRRSRRKPIERFNVSVDGAPSYLIDVSNEGLRLEIPRRGRSSPPPYFIVRIPLIGVALNVQRVWASNAPREAAVDAAWCGVALAENSSRAERNWVAFVDALPGGRA
jgi:CheY-like chemotaxis protein